MSRPLRGDRLTARGRPKRRAAAKANIFKYQLATDPSRIEENDLKRALQESLEEQMSSSNGMDTSIIKAPSPKKARISGNGSSNGHRASSTCDKAAAAAAPPSGKRGTRLAGAASNGFKQNNKCDVNPIPLITLDSPPSSITSSNRVIRTYSRSHQSNNDNFNPQHTNSNGSPQDCLKPSFTPTSILSKPKSITFHSEITNGSPIKSPAKSPSNQSSVSVSTQTQECKAASVNNDNKSVVTNTTNKRSAAKTTPHTKDNGTATTANAVGAPVQYQYLKSKRESKDDAYAKMTALKVSTEKFPSSHSKSSNSKKNSPKGILNNSSANKDSLKVIQQKTRDNSNCSNTTSLNISNPSKNSTGANKVHKQKDKSSHKHDPASTKKYTTVVPHKLPTQTVDLKDDGKQLKGVKGTQSNGTPSKVHLDESGIEYDCSPLGANSDLSNDRDQSQTSVGGTQKHSSEGSWSLLGVPEEKVIYIRDDEPPRRLICYPAIKHVEGDVIQVRDSVLLRSGARKTDLPYIAKVCAFWEDAETGGVMMSLFWYYRPEHTEDGRKPHHLVDEIFASRHRDVDIVECIEDKCYVLTFNEYCRYRKRCKMEQVNATWSLTDVTIPMSNESYPRRNRIPDSDVDPELVFCCRQVYDSRMKRLLKNPLINTKYGHI